MKQLKTGDNIMNSLFEDLCTGLQEAIDFEKGVGSAKKTTYVISPIKEFNPEQIRQIRNNAGMTQTVFANYMGVSKKTVEAWECGRTHPTGPAFRLLDILNERKETNLSFVEVL